MANSKTFVLVYGFGEGNWHSKKMKAELAKRGYVEADKDNAADVVIAHSGGCYFLPDTHKHQLLVLIGPPYWPGKSLASRFIKKSYLDLSQSLKHKKLGYWWQKTAWNMVYLLGDIPLALRMSGTVRKKYFHEQITHNRVLILRADRDAFCSPQIDDLLIKGRHFTVKQIQGQHDDCWLYPEKYLELVD
ncbi:MAG: hypothetical protein JWS12_780 [Candidatus Saccharibacteria bacterium]|nr:hypothetical protein [Candidatus Saccharibacteria bacterium]